MLKLHTVKLDTRHRLQLHRLQRARLSLRVQNVFEVLQRHLRFTIDVDDVPNFLKRTEDKKGINKQGEELPDRDLAGKDQIQHQEHDAGAQRVHTRPLNETEAAQVPNFLELELEYLVGRAVQASDFLLRQPQTLHQLDVAKGFGGRSRQRGCLSNDDLLN